MKKLRYLKTVSGGTEVQTGSVLNIKDDEGLKIADTAVSSTAAELNILDGVTSNKDDLNLLDNMVAESKGIVKVYEEEVDMGAGGSAQTEALVTLPAGSIILEVITRCTEALNGDTTKTFEVGLAANTDKYIDPVDCAVTLNGFQTMEEGTNNDQKVVEVVSASTPIIATWTNTANASAGIMVVKVIYI